MSVSHQGYKDERPICNTQKAAQDTASFAQDVLSARNNIDTALATLRALELARQPPQSESGNFARTPRGFYITLPQKGAPVRERSCSDNTFCETLRTNLEAAAKAIRDIELGFGNALREARKGHYFDNVPDVETRNYLVANFEKHDSEDGFSCSSDEGPYDKTKKDSHGFGRRDSRLRIARTKSFLQKDLSIKDALSNEAVMQALERAGEFDFDCLSFGKLEEVGNKPISIAGTHLEMRGALIERMCQEMQEEGSTSSSSEVKKFHTAFLSFLGELDVLYKEDAIYHGRLHAVDVMSTALWYMKSKYMVERCKSKDYFMALVAGAIHDVGHPGVNNLYLTKTMSPLALRYNDRSILENMHVALAFETMKDHGECDWFKLLDPSGQKHMRTGLINMVLATDMSQHAEMVTKMGEFDVAEDTNNLFMLKTVLHAADISNPAKPHANMLGWTKRVVQEFWAQGDEEQRQGLEISPMCERDSGMKTVPKGQIGFINFVVRPYFTKIQRIIPETQAAVDGLAATTAFWEKVQEEELTYEEIFSNSL